MELEKKNIWLQCDEKEIMDFAGGYMDFLGKVKTERAFVSSLTNRVRALGYKDLAEGGPLAPGDRWFYNHRDKSVFMGVLNEPLKKGLRLIGAHIDAPRLDLKSQPLYEEEGLALFKTHYYGGIKKYQWVTMPLSLQGVIYRKDGSRLEIVIGEDPQDPVFTITDLLPHLAQDQMTKTAGKVIEGEKLNLLVGSIPEKNQRKASEEEPEAPKPSVKKNILKLLKERYDLLEEDFLRAELEVLPNFPPRDIGFDRSLIGGYGQDDRICAYALTEAFLALEEPKGNLMAAFFDKEEIGSNGDTGAQSRILEYLLTLLAKARGEGVTPLEVLFASKALSADVNACEDPSFEGVFDKYNRGTVGSGPVVSKYSGSRGKYEANDASAEFLAYVTALLDKSGVVYQFGELGKIDLGGGGTIAVYLSQLGIETLDLGTGLLSMHSPFEVASKADLYMTKKAYEAFFRG